MKTHRLRDGRSVLIRPLRPEDKQTIQRGWQQLSARSRYFRFLRAIKELSEADLRDLTEVDQQNHVALMAMDPAFPEGPGLGVARWIRVAEEPETAEFAITVVDSCQGQGLGTLLLAFLVKSAMARSVRVLRGWVHPQNAAMLTLFTHAGARRVHSESGIECLELDLPGDPSSAVGKALAGVSCPGPGRQG